MQTPGGPQRCRIVNEAGLYNLILQSRKPQAKQFKRWITHEVLPTILKTGGYIPVKRGESDQDIMARGLVVAMRTIDELDKQRQVIAKSWQLTYQQKGRGPGSERFPCHGP